MITQKKPRHLGRSSVSLRLIAKEKPIVPVVTKAVKTAAGRPLTSSAANLKLTKAVETAAGRTLTPSAASLKRPNNDIWPLQHADKAKLVRLCEAVGRRESKRCVSCIRQWRCSKPYARYSMSNDRHKTNTRDA